MTHRNPQTAFAIILDGGRYTLAAGGKRLSVAPERGGRVCSFAIGPHEFLADDTIHPDNWGSTFWTSPQSDWDWPPIPEIDNQPYEASVHGGALLLRGRTSPRLGVAVEKRFLFDAAADAFVLEYTLRNDRREPVRVAPWEVTRVRASGATLFPSGELRVTGATSFCGLGTEDPERRFLWFWYDAAEIARSQKLYVGAAEGWIAHADDGFLFVKSFPAVPRGEEAPGEAAIEIYAKAHANPGRRYIELEQQGAQSLIPPGGRSVWSVRWYLRPSPHFTGRPDADRRRALFDLVRDVTHAPASPGT